MKNRSLRKENIVQVSETPSANRLGYKTQSKYTKSKSRHRTGTILLKNEKGWSTGKPVGVQPQLLQFRQLAQFSRNGT